MMDVTGYAPDREKGKRIDPPWWMDSNQTDAKETGSRTMWHLHGLSGLQETSKGNVLPLTVNPNQRNLYMGRSP